MCGAAFSVRKSTCSKSQVVKEKGLSVRTGLDLPGGGGGSGNEAGRQVD